MLGLNRVLIAGEVYEKPELRYTPEGVAVACFSITVCRPIAAASGKLQKVSDQFSVVAWRELAERCQEELEEGAIVNIEGRLCNHIWRDMTGRQIIRTEIVVEHLTVLDFDQAGSDDRYSEYEYQWRE